MIPARLIPALLLLVLGWAVAAPSVWAQTKPPGLTWTQTTPPATAAQETGPPDYKAWERTATRAESQTQDSTTSTEALTKMRGYVAEWRATFLAAQNVNSARIATLRGQLDALGAPPAEGAMEEESLAVRRTELSDQLARLHRRRSECLHQPRVGLLERLHHGGDAVRLGIGQCAGVARLAVDQVAALRRPQTFFGAPPPACACRA